VGLQQVIYGSGSCDSCQEIICEYKVPLRQQNLTKLVNQIHYLTERTVSEIKKIIIKIGKGGVGAVKTSSADISRICLWESLAEQSPTAI